eukprot:179401_1
MTERELRVILLLYGYLRGAKSLNTAIPEDIILNICLKFYLQKIDHFKPYYGAQIDSKNNIFEVNPTEQDKRITYCISQICWNKGKHEMMIKILNHTLMHAFSIGILINKGVSINGWLFDLEQAKLSYQFFFCSKNGRDCSGIYQFNNNKSICLQPNDIHTKASHDAIMNNVNIRMLVDCDNWTIQFFYNDKQLGNIVNIEQKHNYYPAIAFRTASFNTSIKSQYQLLLHTKPFC